MTRKIVVSSGKGGVGKTTVVASLGYTLADRGYKVLLVDMDFGLNNLDVLMGIENKIVYDVIDVLENKCTPSQAIIQDFYQGNLYVFPSMHTYCSVKFGANELIEIIKRIEDQFDFVIIDCPAGIDGGFKRTIACGSEFIVVTTPHLSAVRDADKVINCIRSHSRIKPYLLINRARGDLIVDKVMLNLNTICEYLSAEIIGVVPEDDEISKQLLFGGLLDKNSEAQVSFDMIANNLVSDNKKIFDCTKKYKGFFGGIRRNLKRKL